MTKMKQMDLLEQRRITQVMPWIQGRLLDVGCGFNNLVKAYGVGWGVDVFPWEGVDVLIGKASFLPFPNEFFDTVTILAALNHIPNRPEALSEIRRVLRPQGRFLTTMIGPRTGIIAHLLFHRDENARGGLGPDEKKGMTRTEVLALIHHSGFKVIREQTFELGLNRIYLAVKAD